MTAKPEELLKQIQDVSHDFSGHFVKEKIFAAVIFSHPNLNLDMFDEILRNTHAYSLNIFKNISEILTVSAGNNDKYLKHMLIHVNNTEDLAVAFCCAAKNGHLDILKYLADKAPNDLQDMIKADNYAAFRCAAKNGHVAVLEYLKEKIELQQDLQVMIQANSYEAFRYAAKNGHIGVLKLLEDAAPHDLQEMITTDNYPAFRYTSFCYAARNGHLAVLEYLADKIVPKETLQVMI